MQLEELALPPPGHRDWELNQSPCPVQIIAPWVRPSHRLYNWPNNICTHLDIYLETDLIILKNPLIYLKHIAKNIHSNNLQILFAKFQLETIWLSRTFLLVLEIKITQKRTSVWLMLLVWWGQTSKRGYLNKVLISALLLCWEFISVYKIYIWILTATMSECDCICK